MPHHPRRFPIWLASLAFLLAVATVRADESAPVSFVRQVLPILTRQGCNAGSCHG